MPDMIVHKENGYLVDSISTEELANGILWIIDKNRQEREYLRDNAREKVLKNFTPEKVAEEYKMLYRSLGNH